MLRSIQEFVVACALVSRATSNYSMLTFPIQEYHCTQTYMYVIHQHSTLYHCITNFVNIKYTTLYVTKNKRHSITNEIVRTYRALQTKLYVHIVYNVVHTLLYVLYRMLTYNIVCASRNFSPVTVWSN